jgi:Rap1a immunity proteins
MNAMKYALAGGLLLLATAANAVVPAGDKEKKEHEMTGEDLALYCVGNLPDKIKDKEKRASQCIAYILGRDRATTAFSTEHFCSPTITIKDMSIVFLDYLASHREVGQLPAAKSLMTAFQGKWPCAREAREGGSVEEAVRRAQEEISKEKGK